jgi:hypothetical protein
MNIRAWGTRGRYPPRPSTQHYGGNTSCVEVRGGDQARRGARRRDRPAY